MRQFWQGYFMGFWGGLKDNIKRIYNNRFGEFPGIPVDSPNHPQPQSQPQPRPENLEAALLLQTLSSSVPSPSLPPAASTGFRQPLAAGSSGVGLSTSSPQAPRPALASRPTPGDFAPATGSAGKAASGNSPITDHITTLYNNLNAGIEAQIEKGGLDQEGWKQWATKAVDDLAASELEAGDRKGTPPYDNMNQTSTVLGLVNRRFDSQRQIAHGNAMGGRDRENRSEAYDAMEKALITKRNSLRKEMDRMEDSPSPPETAVGGRAEPAGTKGQGGPAATVPQLETGSSGATPQQRRQSKGM